MFNNFEPLQSPLINGTMEKTAYDNLFLSGYIHLYLINWKTVLQCLRLQDFSPRYSTGTSQGVYIYILPPLVN